MFAGSRKHSETDTKSKRQRYLSIPSLWGNEKLGSNSNQQAKLYATMQDYSLGSAPAGDQSILPLDAKQIYRMKISWKTVQRKKEEFGTLVLYQYAFLIGNTQNSISLYLLFHYTYELFEI